MDQDRIKGKGKNIQGRIQEAWGDLTGNAKDELKGQAKQVKGDIQERFGRLKDDIRDVNRRDRDVPEP